MALLAYNTSTPCNGSVPDKIAVTRLNEKFSNFLFSWFRAPLIYISNCPTRCNTKQSIYSSTSSLYMFRVSSTHIIRSTQNCNYSLWYWSYFFVQLPPSNLANLATLEGGSCTVPEAVVTVLCTRDDGCVWHPKHVEWTCRIVNRLTIILNSVRQLNTLLPNVIAWVTCFDYLSVILRPIFVN